MRLGYLTLNMLASRCFRFLSICVGVFMVKKTEFQLKSLDRIDRKILFELQQNGRMSNTELARRINLSATPCVERVRSLERMGIIQGYQAKLNASMLNLELLVFVEITLLRTSPDVFDEFRDAVFELPQILECHLISGDFDYLIKARVADMVAYRKLLGETLLTLPGVRESRTYVVMETVKELQSLPL